MKPRVTCHKCHDKIDPNYIYKIHENMKSTLYRAMCRRCHNDGHNLVQEVSVPKDKLV